MLYNRKGSKGSNLTTAQLSEWSENDFGQNCDCGANIRGKQELLPDATVVYN